MPYYYFPSRVILTDSQRQAQDEYQDLAPDFAQDVTEVSGEIAAKVEAADAASLDLLKAAERMARVIEHASRRKTLHMTCLDVETKDLDDAYSALTLAISLAS